MNIIKRILTGVLVLLFAGCSFFPSQPLRISANLWIGYMPLFYIKERGWLDGTNIELVNVVSLYENMQMYAIGNADAFTGTQYEYHLQRRKHPNLVPVVLFDRSVGGDLVMGNISLRHLRDRNTTIDVYMEVDSVNSELFEAFVHYTGTDMKRFHIVNLDPQSISQIKMRKKPTLIVTYKPFDEQLRKQGYRTLLDTRNPALPFMIIDALYIDEDKIRQFSGELETLNRLIARALRDLRENPRRFYEYVRYYLQGENYATFLESVESIEWIYDNRRPDFLQMLEKQGFPTRKLMEPVREI